ncbi:hypothetical protein JG688_00008157 [Phytophthora aleatoria]|uniref:Uncharacterized protein n=1 Tax=Phytophthora aleatoria TaxID=2496075 RepID=A0A8J5MG92_9STRA|nr:hypothetical protein JG688_00008157 [Phytophthora aleatoria]
MCARATTCITCGPARPHTSPFTCILNLGMASPIQLFRLAPCTRAYALRPSLMCCSEFHAEFIFFSTWF